MPAEPAHIALANRSQCSLSCLINDTEDHSEWITVIAFYKALHVVEAVLARDGNHSHDHVARDATLKGNPRYDKIYRHYRPLSAAATVARYLASPGGQTYKSFADYLSRSDVIDQMVNHHLHQVEKSASKFLGKNCGLHRCT